MKLLIATALVGLALSQNAPSTSEFNGSPVKRHENIIEEKQMVEQPQIQLQRPDFEIEQPAIQIEENIPNQEKIEHEIIPEEMRDRREKHRNSEMNQKHLRRQENRHPMRDQHQKKNHKKGCKKNMHEMPVPPPMNGYGPHEQHNMEGKHRKGDYRSDNGHRRPPPHGIFMPILYAFIFTFIGIMLGRVCCRGKCKNNRRNSQIKPRPIQRTSQVIKNQIQQNERKSLQLQEELETKKREQARNAEESRRLLEARRIHNQRLMNNFRVPEYMDHRYNGYNMSQERIYRNIPVGRPIYENSNKNFAPEYPSL